MIRTILIICTTLLLVKPQTIDIQELNENHGYIIIKLGEQEIVKNFKKNLHIINITEYETARDLIGNNIETIRDKHYLIEPMYATLTHHFDILNRKINNLKPHTRHTRRLINILGTGLKYISGTMDNRDEEEIKSKLSTISQSNTDLIEESNKQILINNAISNQLKNLTEQINSRQNDISKFLNDFNIQNENNLTKIEDEIKYIQNAFQINYDISLIEKHINDIKEILLTSKLGILSKNILTEKELKMIHDFKNLIDIKIVIAFHLNQIIIIIYIPEYTDTSFYKLLIEPIPNKENKCINLNDYNILMDPERQHL